MNSYQRRKLARQKEREAQKLEIKMIANPTLTTDAHPANQKKLVETLMTEPKTRQVYHTRYPHSLWNQLRCGLGWHCKFCVQFGCENCCRCEEAL